MLRNIPCLIDRCCVTELRSIDFLHEREMCLEQASRLVLPSGQANCAEECACPLQKDQDRPFQGERYNPLTSFALFSTGPLFNV